jgi:hypothetical protein
MAARLTEDDIDDLIYFARSGEKDELLGLVTTLAAREKASDAEIMTAARDQSKSTCLHMATGNGHIGMSYPCVCVARVRYIGELSQAPCI